MSVTPGWDSIAAHLASAYPGQEPKHWGTIIRYADGGPDPLDGISAYRVADPPHWHWVGMGMSELGTKRSENKDVSGWGFEFSFRLKRGAGEDTPPEWPVGFLQKLAMYVYNTRNPFAHEHYIRMGGPISPDEKSVLTALVFTVDTVLKHLDTPNGRVDFLTIIGITADEHQYADTAGPEKLLQLLLAKNPLGVTDLRRRSLLTP